MKIREFKTSLSAMGIDEDDLVRRVNDFIQASRETDLLMLQIGSVSQLEYYVRELSSTTLEQYFTKLLYEDGEVDIEHRPRIISTIKCLLRDLADDDTMVKTFITLL